MTVSVRALEHGDRERWQQLYAGYGDFYEKPLSDEKADLVFSWLLDPDHESHALVAFDDDRLVGIGHYREFSRPLAGGRGLYLDDLFVEPDARGAGAATAIIEALRLIAIERGLGIVRWITASDNTRAQRIYDRLATRTRWVTYDMEV